MDKIDQNKSFNQNKSKNLAIKNRDKNNQKNNNKINQENINNNDNIILNTRIKINGKNKRKRSMQSNKSNKNSKKSNKSNMQSNKNSENVNSNPNCLYENDFENLKNGLTVKRETSNVNENDNNSHTKNSCNFNMKFNNDSYTQKQLADQTPTFNPYLINKISHGQIFPTNINAYNHKFFNYKLPVNQTINNIPMHAANFRNTPNYMYNSSLNIKYPYNNSNQNSHNAKKYHSDLNTNKYFNFNNSQNSDMLNINPDSNAKELVKQNNNEKGLKTESNKKRFKDIYKSLTNYDLFNLNISKMILNFNKSFKADCKLIDYFHKFFHSSIFGIEVFYYYEGN